MFTALLWVLGAFLLLAALVVGWLISTYNSLIRQRNLRNEAWSGILVQLKKRHDLVGNLVNSVKGFMSHERAILEEVARARSAAIYAKGVASVGAREGALSQALSRLFAVAENYPELRSSSNMLQLQNTLKEIEEGIGLSRRYYNGTVRDLNNRIETFPTNLAAGLFGFQRGEFFELEDPAEAEAPSVQFE